MADSTLQPQVCNICESFSEDGINILGLYMCLDCEQSLVNSDVKDAEYPQYVDKIKKRLC